MQVATKVSVRAVYFPPVSVLPAGQLYFPPVSRQYSSPYRGQGQPAGSIVDHTELGHGTVLEVHASATRDSGQAAQLCMRTTGLETQ
jgi:hypothetical protein